MSYTFSVGEFKYQTPHHIFKTKRLLLSKTFLVLELFADFVMFAEILIDKFKSSWCHRKPDDDVSKITQQAAAKVVENSETKCAPYGRLWLSLNWLTSHN